jgi:hypothetical protein
MPEIELSAGVFLIARLALSYHVSKAETVFLKDFIDQPAVFSIPRISFS